MGRTKLRGIEIAGIRIAVEAPARLDWDPERGPLAPYATSPIDPHVYVGVSVGSPRPPRDRGFAYESAGCRFEISREDDAWVVGVHGCRPYERVARFDADFRHAEVTVSPELASDPDANGPLAYPLDEVLVLHRLLREGGLILRGHAVRREGRALVFTGTGASEDGDDSPSGWRQIGTTPSAGDRVAIRLDTIHARAYGLPWSERTAEDASGELDAIHSLVPAAAVYTEPLDEADAQAEVLAHAFAPVHDPEGAANVAPVVEELVRRVPVVRLGLPAENRVIPFTWGDRQAALAFAPPFVR